MARKIATTGRHRLAHGLTAVLLATGTGAGLATVGAAPSYAATPRNFCQPGSTKITWSSISKPWAVDHAKQWVNQQPGTVTDSVTTTSKEVVSSSAGAETGVTINENTLIESLQAHVKLTLARAGSHTTSRSETFTVKLSPQSTDVVFHAVHVVRGTYTHWRCAVNSWVSNGTGIAHSWYIDAQGAVNCPGSKGYRKPRAGTAARAAQKFC
jgi:hypothetical protein